jgi:hypothetical protein
LAGEGAVKLTELITNMRRYITLATFDVVVILDGQGPPSQGRIRVPDSRREEVLRFCRLFGLPNIDFAPHPNAFGWVEITFDIDL